MYDVFISYSLHDQEWAAKLENDLKGRGFNVFRDITRLTPGAIWEKSLQSALRDSNHLVVLWSDKTRESDWVQKELTHFDILSAEDSRRLLIAVNLQGQNKTVAKYEAIDLIEKAQAYNNGVKNVPASLWKEILDKIEEAIRNDAIPVYTIVLTSTLPRLQTVPLNERPNPFAPSYKETLESIGIKVDGSDVWKNELGKYYGQQRSEWKPFAGTKSIDAILDDLRNSILARYGVPKFRWRPVGGDFWLPEFDAVIKQAEKLAGEFFVIIVDPISLYDREVLVRLDRLRSRLHNRSGVSVLAPFAMPPATAHLRTLLQRSAEELYNQFYWPTFDNEAQRAHISVCEDDRDVTRLVSTMLQPGIREIEVHPFVRA